MSQDVKTSPNYFEECPKKPPTPIECMLTLQEIWEDHEHFDYVDVTGAVYIVRLRIPRDTSHYVKEARYQREIKLDIDIRTGDARWLLLADNLHGSHDVFYKHELEKVFKAEIQVGATIPTPLRAVRIGEEEFWTNNEDRLVDLRQSARDAQLVEDDLDRLREEAEG